MSLASRASDLATAVGNYLRDAVLPRLLPAGGSSGQALVKSSASDYAVAWATPSGGGGATVYIQDTDPAAASPYIWFRTDLATGKVIDILQG